MTLAARHTGADDALARALIDEVQQEYIARYGGRDSTPVEAGQFAPPGGAFLVLTADGEPVGCGGLRAHDAGVAEVKRMYVRASHRGRGYGRHLLEALEHRARALGYRRVVLETGMQQPEAMGLYAAAGYTPIAPYGHHRCSPLSRCFSRDL